METTRPPFGTWRFNEAIDGRIEASIDLAAGPAGAEARRRLYHDYIGAIRTLRYLAQKGLKGGEDSIDPLKQAAFDKHLSKLEALQTLVIEPLLGNRENGLNNAP